MNVIHDGINPIEQIFEGARFFVVPIYQRAYAWEDKQLIEFISDVQSQSKTDGKKYFFGTFLFQIAGKEGDYHKIFIVDGQQRLTTLIIFINELLSIWKSRGANYYSDKKYERYIIDEGVQKFQTIPTDNFILKDYILGNHKDPEIKLPSQRRLIAAKKFFSEELNKLGDEELKNLFDLIESAYVLTYTVTDNAEATLIFETTNDRGRRLTDLEAVKSFLMHKIYLALTPAAASNALGSMQAYFSEIYRNCEQLENKINEEEGLRYYYIAYRRTKSDYTSPKEDIKGYVSDLFAKDKSVAAAYAQELSLEIKDNFDKLRGIYHNEDRIDWLDDLIVLKRIAVFYPMLLKSFCRVGDSNFNSYKKIVRLCEIFSLTVWGISGYRSDKGVSHLHLLARQYNGKEKNHDWLVKSLKSFLDVLESEKWFRKGLNNPGFYHSGINARYILWKYENSLRDCAGHPPMPVSDFTSSDSRKRLTIEHIAAQKGEEIKNFQLEINGDDSFKDDFLHQIGNLAIDPQSPNSAKSNIPVPQKSKIFNKAPFMSQNELDDFLDNGEWTVKSIGDRAKKLIIFASDHWDYKKI